MIYLQNNIRNFIYRIKMEKYNPLMVKRIRKYYKKKYWLKYRIIKATKKYLKTKLKQK